MNEHELTDTEKVDKLFSSLVESVNASKGAMMVMSHSFSACLAPLASLNSLVITINEKGHTVPVLSKKWCGRRHKKYRYAGLCTVCYKRIA